jgi:hypothetical protein
MPKEIKTIKGYSKTSFEEALENAIAQVKVKTTSADELFHYPIVQMGKEMGGIAGRNDYYVVITVVE